MNYYTASELLCHYRLRDLPQRSMTELLAALTLAPDFQLIKKFHDILKMKFSTVSKEYIAQEHNQKEVHSTSDSFNKATGTFNTPSPMNFLNSLHGQY